MDESEGADGREKDDGLYMLGTRFLRRRLGRGIYFLLEGEFCPWFEPELWANIRFGRDIAFS